MKEKQYCCFCGNKLVSRYLENRDRLFCQNCQCINYENPLPAAAAVVFNSRNEILLVKRNVDPEKGQWCLPGGFAEVDEMPEEACLRELKEESGLTGRVAGLVDIILSPSPEYKAVYVIGYLVKDVTGDLCAGDDTEQVAFFDLSERPPLAFRSHEALLRKALEMASAGWKMSGTGRRPVPKIAAFGAYVITSNQHVTLVREACAAGARIVQYRDKEAPKKVLLDTAKTIRELTRATNTIFIVNDHLDIALLVGADGVHLGQDDLPVTEARRLVPDGFLIGVSTHSLEQALAAEAEGADYIGIGPVFATPTKKSYTPIGLQVVETVIRQVKIPAVAIGGLFFDNLDAVLKVGVKNIAMVREFQENTGQIVQVLNKLLLKE